MQLSGPAHKLIGNNAAALVLANLASNGGPESESSATTRIELRKAVPEFNLKLPPGF